MTDFFISYTQKDSYWAQWIASQLEEAGYHCIVQAWDFTAGVNFMQKMRQAIETSQQTITVMSAEYFNPQHPFAQAELEAVLTKDPDGSSGKILPIRVEDIEPPDLMRNRVYIDLVDKTEDAAKRELLDGVLASRIGRKKPEEAARFPGASSFPGKKKSDLSIAGETKSTERIKTELKVLFLAADVGVNLDLKGEFQKIKAVIKPTKFADFISLSAKFDVCVEDLITTLNQYNPDVFHFSGSFDNKNVVYFHSRDGGRKPLNSMALRGLFGRHKDNIKLAVFNACHSLQAAEAFAEVIDCTIGIKGAISDNDAIKFAKFLYGAIGEGRSIKDAIDDARDALLFDSIAKDTIPELRCRKGVDPAKLFLLS